VVYVENPTKKELEHAIGMFAGLAGEANVAITYFSGHGSTFSDVTYLVPTDVEFDSLSAIPYELVKVEDFIGELRRARSVRIALIDACRDDDADLALKTTTGTKGRRADERTGQGFQSGRPDHRLRDAGPHHGTRRRQRQQPLRRRASPASPLPGRRREERPLRRRQRCREPHQGQATAGGVGVHVRQLRAQRGDQRSVQVEYRFQELAFVKPFRRVHVAHWDKQIQGGISHMPLDRNHIDPIEEHRGGILFAMIRPTGFVIPCSLTRGALSAVAGGGWESPSRAFIAHRETIEAAASAKYDRGRVEPDGGIALRAIDFAGEFGATN
jgi:hypothetical protein